MPPKDNKRKNAGQTGTTQPKRQKTEPARQPRFVKGNVCMNVL